MRNFSEADRKKKQARIQIEENPGNLSRELLEQLASKVKASLRDGYISCPVAWKIARESNVPKIAVGKIADRLSIRITNCQLGCFRVDKATHDNTAHRSVKDEVVTMLEALSNDNELTCARVFELARQLKSTPLAIADIANLRNWKIRHCQLGCF